MTRIDLDGGKYSVLHHQGVGLRALRHGEPWRDCSGDGLVLALAQEVEGLREQQAVLAGALRHYANGDSLSGHIAREALAAAKVVG